MSWFHRLGLLPVLKENPYHDRLGRFARAENASSPSEHREAAGFHSQSAKIAPNQESVELHGSAATLHAGAVKDHSFAAMARDASKEAHAKERELGSSADEGIRVRNKKKRNL